MASEPEPALAPPFGVESNFVNPPNSHAMIIGVMSLFLLLTTAFILPRMLTRVYVHQELWWDDWTMFTGWIGLVGLVGAQLVQLQYGAGVDQWNVTKANYRQFAKIFSDIEIVARIAIFFTKLSILLLYLRIFFPLRTRRTKMWYWIQTVIWFNVLYTLALILVVTLQCTPYNLPYGDSCVNEWAVLVGASIINVVSDIAILIIPLEAVWKLQMDQQRKMAMFLVFAFGAVAPLSSIARLGYQIPEARNTNRTKVLVTVNILAMAENVIAVIVGCMPVLSVWVFRLHSRRSVASEMPPKSLLARFWASMRSPEVNTASSGPRGRKSRRRGAPDPFSITRAERTVDDHRAQSRRALTIVTTRSLDEEAGETELETNKQPRNSSSQPIHGVALPTTTTTIEGGLKKSEEKGGLWHK